MFRYGCDYYPEQWPESCWVEDARGMAAAGFNVVRIGEFAWARMEPHPGQYDWEWLDRAIAVLAENGLGIVLGTPTAAPPPWLTSTHPQVLPRDVNRRVRHAGSRRHYCPNNPVYHDYTWSIVTALAGRYGHDERIIGWQIDNEFGDHDTGRCYCDVCAAGFREWLRARYGTMEALNEAWGGVFWSALYSDWAEIPLPWPAPSAHNPSLVLDFYRFSSASICAYQQIQVDILRSLTTGQFLTHNLVTFPSRDVDYHNLVRPLDFVSWDNYHYQGATPALVAATHDMRWGLKRRNFWVMEQQLGQVNWAPYNPTLRPGEVGLKVWQSVAHGADGVVYFRWRAARHGAELYHSALLDYSRHPTRGYQEAAAIGRDLAQLDALLADSVPPAEVAMLHDYPSRWALDLQPHNDDLADDETFRRALLGPYEALWARHVPVHILSARGDDDLTAYRLVIVPALHLVGPEITARLAAYVDAGGTLLVTARSGFKDERGAVPGRPPGHLAELLGVEVEEFDSLPPERGNRVRFIAGPTGAAAPVALWCEVLAPTTAEPLAVYEGDYYAGRPAATRRTLGHGQALYVGVLPGPEFYGPLLEWLLPQLGISPLLPAPAPPGVEVVARVGPAGRLLFLLHHDDSTVQLTLPPGCRDALSGEPLTPTLSLGPRQVRIVRG